MASMYAYLDDFGKIRVWINRNFYGGRSDTFYIVSDHGYCSELIVVSVQDHDSQIRYELTGPAGLEFGRRYFVRESHGLCVPLVFRLIVNTAQFASRFAYHGNDLGPVYHKEYTDFAVWAPTANEILLKLRHNDTVEVHSMKRTDKGVYRLRIYGDLKRDTYTYIVDCNGYMQETIDPYAYSSNGNAMESAVIDLNEIMQIRDHDLPDTMAPTDAIIYEASVRDMTSSPLSGTRTHGTFAALSEENTVYGNMPTGLNYLTSLGVTHIQLLPVMDFITVDEFHPEKNYNWGYDPIQYMVPEGSYSSDPDDPYARVRELRELVCTLHKHGLRVNLDVVFNHMYGVEVSAFHRLVPYYYFRYNENAYLSNGTFCGNDFASEKIMARRYILHVIESLMKVYCVDGFRFDLMGILDIDTMNEIMETARKIKPDAMIYGEGWDMPTILPADMKAMIANQAKMPGIGHFNDFFRDIIKGKTSDDQKYEKGYATGDLAKAFGSLSALSANVLGDPYYKRFSSPCQSINGLETHDNNTLWDKMHACCGNEDRTTRQKRHKMMLAVTMAAQGIPFLHAGIEFCGTKNDNSNSYNAGDDINRMDWQRAEINRDIIEYTKKCISMRRKYRAFRLTGAKQIEQFVRLSVAEGGIAFYDITCGDPATDTQMVRVMINPGMVDKTYPFEPGWRIILDENGHEKPADGEVRVPALSVIVCAR